MSKILQFLGIILILIIAVPFFMAVVLPALVMIGAMLLVVGILAAVLT